MNMSDKSPEMIAGEIAKFSQCEVYPQDRARTIYSTNAGLYSVKPVCVVHPDLKR